MERNFSSAWTSALMVALAAIAVSCSSSAPKPSAPEAVRAELGATNAVLADAVYSELNASPTHYFRHVDVTVDDGVAYLSGYVWSTDAIYAARKIAANVPGITGVATSQLQLERNGRDSAPTR